ncbi:MAG: hypothetical protein FJ399_00405 [Verrucomicrobia bacterium]|nr:hypothetical protein [Verrucomicrobiota bacterium]
MEILIGLIGLVMIMLWFVSVGRIGQIRDEVRRHTELLQRIAGRLPPNAEESREPTQLSGTGLEAPKSYGSTVVGVLALVLIMVVLLLVSRQRH